MERENLFVGEFRKNSEANSCKECYSLFQMLTDLYKQNKELSKRNAELESMIKSQEKFIPIFDYKERRKALKLTLREVEKDTGISNSYLSQLESGKIKKPSYNVVKILDTYYSELLTNINEKI